MTESIENLVQNQRELFNRIAIGAAAISCAGGAYLAVNMPNFEAQTTCIADTTTIKYDLETEAYKLCHDGNEVVSIATPGVIAATAATYGLTVTTAALMLKPNKRDFIEDLDNRETNHTTK